MKTALIVNEIIGKDKSQNIKNIISGIEKAASEEAELAVFSETAITGLINNDDIGHDLKLGVSKDSYEINSIRECAKKCNIDVCIGYFELEGNILYDSAIYIDCNGKILENYRRQSIGWRDPSIDGVYAEGQRPCLFKTRFGNMTILICGDLFDDEILEAVKELKADYLLFPFARSFFNGEASMKRWIDEEEKDYCERIKRLKTFTFLVNYIGEPYFGGAFVINEKGDVVSTLELGRKGILYYEKL